MPLGVIFLPEGEDIEDYDVEQNLIPLANINMAGNEESIIPINENINEPARDNPKTGENISAILGLLMLTIAGVIIFRKKITDI